MKPIITKLHEENIDAYMNDEPYVKEYEDGTVDYCLGRSYEQAATVIKALLVISREHRMITKKAELERKKAKETV